MELYLYQFFAFIFGVAALSLLTHLLIKKKYRSSAVLTLVIWIIATVSPVRFSAPDGGASLERSVRRFESMPEKVSVEKPNFEALRREQLAELKANNQEEINL